MNVIRKVAVPIKSRKMKNVNLNFTIINTGHTDKNLQIELSYAVQTASILFTYFSAYQS